jgi:hypothetical protein
MEIPETEVSDIISSIRDALIESDSLSETTEKLKGAGQDASELISIPVTSFLKGIPPELMADVAKTVGPDSLLRGPTTLFNDMGRALVEIAAGDRGLFESFVEGIAQTGSKFVSGRHRASDQLDTITEQLTGDFAPRDKKGEHKNYWQAITYMDNMLNKLFDTEQAPIKSSTTGMKAFSSGWENSYLTKPPSAFQKLMGEVGMPVYKAEARNIFGEVENALDKRIYSALERKAAVILGLDPWAKAKDQRTKLKMVKWAINSAKNEIIEQFAEENINQADVYVDPNNPLEVIGLSTQDDDRKIFLLSALSKEANSVRSINNKISEKNSEGRYMFYDKDNEPIEKVYDLSNAQLQTLLDYYTLDAKEEKTIKKIVTDG